MIRCGFIGRVGAIRLPANGLRGTIPQDIGRFQALHSLDLSHNFHLQGDRTLLNYVSEITNLREFALNSFLIPYHLQLNIFFEHSGFLILKDTPIRGPIPPSIAHLTKLDTLTLSNCSLTGTIPTEIGLISTLTSFSAEKNHINGTIPSEVGLLDRLIHLNLDTTSLSGSLPLELQHLSNLDFLDIHDNPAMTGTVPDFIGSMESLGESLLICDGSSYNKIGLNVAR